MRQALVGTFDLSSLPRVMAARDSSSFSRLVVIVIVMCVGFDVLDMIVELVFQIMMVGQVAPLIGCSSYDWRSFL